MQKTNRLKREVASLMNNPPAGIACFPRDDNLLSMDASIMGVTGTPYESGIFKIEILITDRYPFEPPRLRFLTPVYHPNIDNTGRICLDLLKLPPAGTWKPIVTIEGILMALQVLLANPNPDDPLMEDIAKEYTSSKEEFERKAKDFTSKYACQSSFKPVESGNSISKPDHLSDSTHKHHLLDARVPDNTVAKRFKGDTST